MTISDPQHSQQDKAAPPARPIRLLVYVLVTLVLGLSGGYLLWGRGGSNSLAELTRLAAEQPIQEKVVALPEQYTLPATFGDIGPKLLEAGAIDYDQFIQIYERAGRPLSTAQQRILSAGSGAQITIDQENAYFLLNFFWAFGLTNQNPILEEGPLMQYGDGDIGHFASTGGWTLGTLPATELYASTPIITLTAEQQSRLEEVAYAVYRPCCNNHTAFADCNHGMAMLGLLEVMAAQGATTDEMFEAAKYINAFWFPQQSAELAMLYAVQGQDFADINAREAVGRDYFSSTGFQAVHRWIIANNLLKSAPAGGNSCGV